MRAYIVLAVIIGSGFAVPLKTIEDIEDLQKNKKLKESEHIEDHEHKARAYYDASLNLLPASGYGSGLSTSVSISGAGGSGYAAPASAGGYSGSSAGVGLAGLGGSGYSGAASSGYSGGASSGGYSGASAVGGHLGGAGGYGASGISGLIGLGGVSGPAVGIFPNALVGGCNVPLLLSCAPNVVSGHLAAAGPHSYSAPAYRSFEEDMMKEAEWKARKASHHVVSQDYPEPHPGSHHVVSQDYPEPNVTRLLPVHPESEKAEKKLN